MTSIEDVASPKKSEMMNSQLWLWLRADMALEWQIVMGPGLIWKKLNKII